METPNTKKTKGGSAPRRSSRGSTVHTQSSIREIEKKLEEDTVSTDLEKAEYFYALGCSLKDQGNFSQAIESFDSAIRMYQSESNQENAVVQTMHQLVILYLHQKKIPYVEGILSQALELQGIDTEDSNSDLAPSAYHSLDTLEASRFTAMLAETYYQFGLLRQAEKKYQHAIIDISNTLQIYEALRINDEKITQAHHQLGMLYRLQNNYDLAIKSFEHVLRAIDPENETEEKADALLQLGLTYQAQGNQEAAIRSLENALSVYRVLTSGDNDPDIASVLSLLGQIYLDQGVLDTAGDLCVQALEEFGKGTENLYVADMNYCLGVIHHRQDNYSEALAQFDKALNLFRELEQDNTNALKIADIIHRMGQLYQLQQNNQIALAYFQEALSAYEDHFIETDVRQNMADIHRGMGEIYLVERDLGLANASLSEALKMYQIIHLADHETIKTTRELLRESTVNPIIVPTMSNPETNGSPQAHDLARRKEKENPKVETTIQQDTPHQDLPGQRTVLNPMRSDSPLDVEGHSKLINGVKPSYGAVSTNSSERSESNEGGMLAYLCSCCGLFGKRSTKNQGSPLSDSLTKQGVITAVTPAGGKF